MNNKNYNLNNNINILKNDLKLLEEKLQFIIEKSLKHKNYIKDLEDERIKMINDKEDSIKCILKIHEEEILILNEKYENNIKEINQCNNKINKENAHMIIEKQKNYEKYEQI